MAIEIEIQAQDAYNNLQEIIDNIKALKQAAREAKTEEEFERITRELGRARKALKDFNDDVKTNAAGSVFERMNRQTRELGDNIRNLNFADAGGDLQNLAVGFNNINFKSISAGLKDVTKGFGALGRAILTNPYTYLAIAIAAVTAALVGFANRLGYITPIIKFFTDAIDGLVQKLKDLGDYFKFTSFKIDEASAKSQKATERVIGKLNATIAKNKETQEKAIRDAETAVAIAKIQGKGIEEIFNEEKKLLDAKKKLNAETTEAIGKALQDEQVARSNNLKFLIQTEDERAKKIQLVKDAGTKSREDELAEIAKFNRLIAEQVQKREQIQKDVRERTPFAGDPDNFITVAERGAQKAIAANIKIYQENIDRLEAIVEYSLSVEEEKITELQNFKLVNVSALMEMDQEAAAIALAGIGITKQQQAEALSYIKTYQDLKKMERDSTKEGLQLLEEEKILQAQKTQDLLDESTAAAQKRKEIEEELSKQLIAIRTQNVEKSKKLSEDFWKYEETQAENAIENAINNGDLQIDEAKRLFAALKTAREQNLNAEKKLITQKYQTEIDENERAIKDLETQRTALTDKNGKIIKEENQAILDSLNAQIEERKKYTKTLEGQKDLELKIVEDTSKKEAETEKRNTRETLEAVIKTKEEQYRDDAQKRINAMAVALAAGEIEEWEYNDFRTKINAETELAIQNERKRTTDAFVANLNAQLAQESNFLNRGFNRAISAIKTRINSEKKARIDAIDKQMQELEAAGNKETELYKQLADEKIQIEKNAQNAILSVQAEAEARKKAMIEDTFNAAFNFNDSLLGFAEARQERELYGFEQRRDAELKSFDESLQNQVNAAGTNEEEINRIKEQGANARAAIEKRLTEEEDAIKKNAFENNKKFAVAQAIIAGAQGVVAAFGSLPSEPTGLEIAAKVAFAASIATTTIAQIAKIKATQYRGTSYSAPNITSPLSGGGAGGAGGATQPNFSFFGNNNAGNELGATGGNRMGAPGTNITVDVNISESEITNTQQRVARLTSAAEL